MTRLPFITLALASLLAGAAAQAQDKPSQATIDSYIKATFGKASPEWQARITPVAYRRI